MSAPVRIQRQRTKGWRMPENTVYVGRPCMFGNPFAVKKYNIEDLDGTIFAAWRVFHGDVVIDIFATQKEAATEAVRLYRGGLRPRNIQAARRKLRGKNLACWCALDQPCHADVLLEIANGPIREEVE